MIRLGHVKKAALFMFAGIIFSKFFSYIYRLIVSRLGPSDYGVFSLGYAIYGFALIFALLGLHDGVLRYVPFYRARKESGKEKGVLITAGITVLVVSVIIAALLYSLSGFFAEVFNAAGLGGVIKIFSIGLPFAALGIVFIWALKSYRAVKKAVIAQHYLEGLAKILLTVLLLYLGFGLLGAITGFVLAIFVMFGISLIFICKYIKKNIKAELMFKELLPYSIPLMFSGFLYFIIYYTDSLMIGYFGDAAKVGVYNVALPTAGLLFIIPEAILVIFVPLMTEYFVKNNKNKFKELYRKSFWYSFLLNLPVFIVLLVFSRFIINILFGDAYVLGSTALSILAIGYFFRLMFMPNTKLLEVFKKQNVILAITIIAAIMNVIINYFLIPIYGIIGGAMATSITYVFIGATNFGFSRKYFKRFVG